MFCLVLSDHATTVAGAYGLGTPVGEMIMVARGEQSRVWRLDTDTGGFAIKELVIRQTPDDAAADVGYQEAMLASGAVPMPRPIRTVARQVLVDVAGYQVRAYEWVDLLAMDTDLDPAVVGATLAAIHQVPDAPHAPARRLIHRSRRGATVDPTAGQREGSSAGSSLAETAKLAAATCAYSLWLRWS